MESYDVYKHANEALEENMDGELLIYHPPTAITLHLNGPSAVVWELCDGARTIGEIIRMVEQAYPDQAAQIEDDVKEVIEDLSSRGVLTHTA